MEEHCAGSSIFYLSTIIHLIPLRKLPKPLPDPNLGSKSIVALEACAVRIGDRHIAGLHAYELPVAFEIVVLRQDTRTNEFFLQGRNVVQQVFGGASADVVDSVGPWCLTPLNFYKRSNLH